MKIFLDDERNPPDDTWVVARSPEDFKELWNNFRDDITAISFDHDLQDNHDPELTGYTCLCWVEKDYRNDSTMKLPELYIHTWNPVGRRRLQLVIDSLHMLEKVDPID